MPKTIVLILTLLGITSYAQITVDANDMPQVGHSYISQNILDFIIIDASLTGASYNWDFSSVIGLSRDTLKPVSVSSTPLAYQFFFNNMVLYPDHVADYAIASEDIDGAGVVSLTERFEYFRDDASGHKTTGFGANINGIPTSVKYDQIDVIYDFPMDYGNNSGSDASYLISVPTIGTYGQNFSRSKEVDGWGTVSTPFGTFDCLRVKTTLTTTDTLYLDAAGIGSSIPRGTEYIYDWIAKSEGIPVFTAIANAAGVVTAASYLTEHLTSTESYATGSVKLFPNPTSGRINIESDLRGNYLLFDLTGKLIKRDEFEAFTKIDLSSVKSGLYTITLIAKNGQMISKRVEILH
jgi:hypothetical protein